MACRTRFYDQYFLDATRSGIGQVVILASGLDSRAYRLPWPPGTVVYEVDMPEVIEFKTLTLGDLGAEPTAERRTVAIDLRDDWASALQAAGFDPQAPSAWSAEGLVVYLPDEAQDALFDNITTLSAPGSHLAFEFVPDTAVFADPRWRAHHDRMSELGFEIDFNDLVYHGQRSHIVDHLSQRGWQTTSTDRRGAACGQRVCLRRRRRRRGLRRYHLQQRGARAMSRHRGAHGRDRARCGAPTRTRTWDLRIKSP